MPLAITYQPDWIIAALGLKPITPEEAAKIKVTRGEVRGTTALVFPATKNGNETYTRMMIVEIKPGASSSIGSMRAISSRRRQAREACWPRPRSAASPSTTWALPTRRESRHATCPKTSSSSGRRDQLTLDVTLQRCQGQPV